MNFSELVKSRHSVRSFSDRPVEKEKMDLILEAGRVAPTAKNMQPQRLFVCQSKESMEKLGTVCSCLFGAPTAVLFCYEKGEAWVNPYDKKIHSGYVNTSIVCTHMMLQAWDLGIASCWVGRFDPKEVANAFEIPDHLEVVAILPLGYASENSKPNERHFLRKELSETVTYL